MSFLKKVESCAKVGRPAPGPVTPLATSGTPRNRGLKIYLRTICNKNLSAQLLLTAENEHPACGIRPAPPPPPQAAFPPFYTESVISVQNR